MYRYALGASLLVAPPLAAQTAGFAQQIAPFAVENAADGQALDYPMLGGFDEPKPQWVDLDGDGDDDLVVQDLQLPLLYFENTGGVGSLVPRPGVLDSIQPGGWFRFGDVDGDGDLDALTNAGAGQVAFWRNEGSAEDARFVLAQAPLIGSNGLPVGLEDTNVPDLADVDGDGDLDLLGGRTDQGTIVLYRHDGLADGVPQFTFVTETYGGVVIFEFDPQCPGGGRQMAPSAASGLHGQNGLSFTDYDADGDLDLFWGDYFSYGVRLYESGGGAALSFVTEDYPLGEDDQYNGFFVPTFGDPDADGDLDLLYGNLRGFCGGRRLQSRIDNTLYYENVGTRAEPVYQRRTDRQIRTLDFGTTSAPAMADFDGDGDRDLVVGVGIDPGLPSADVRRSSLHYLRNDGTASAPRFVEVEDDLFGLDFGLGSEYAPAAGDLNGDGTPDLIVADFNGRFAVFLSPGGPAPLADFVRSDAVMEGVRQQSVPRPTLGDVDGDGDLDLLIGRFNGAVALWENVGTPQSARFERVDDAFLTANVNRPAAPALGDLDGDGDPDLVIGVGEGDLQVFRNDGALQFSETEAFRVPALFPVPTLADADGDGDADLLIGTESGGLLYYENLISLQGEPEPRPAGRFQAFPNPSAGAVTFAVGALGEGGTVEVLDVLGRRMALVQVRARDRTARWEGDAGAGLYVARLRTARGEVVATTRVSVVR
jgi:hypothetical protein